MKPFIENLRAQWSQKHHHDKLIFAGSAIFLLVIIFFMVAHGTFLTPDIFFVIGFVIALAIGQWKIFLWDWTPLVLLILSYEYLRGIIPQINKQIHFSLMPDFDKLIFGRIPTIYLQQKFFQPSHIHWYDYAAVLLYLSHFVVPLFTAFMFWLTDRKYFKEYAVGFLGLSYLTFLTYLAFPAAPPWMASMYGTIPHVDHLIDILIVHLYPSVSLPTVYRYFGANLTAAVPSLHAAYPLLTSLYIYKKKPKLLPLLIVYVLGLWLAVIYLGEHYVFDVILGATYALLVYAVVQRFKLRHETKVAQTLALAAGNNL